MGIVLTGGSPRADVELAQRSEAAGFDHAFTIEFFHRHGYVRMIASAGAVADGYVGHPIATRSRHREVTRPLALRAFGPSLRAALLPSPLFFLPRTAALFGPADTLLCWHPGQQRLDMDNLI